MNMITPVTAETINNLAPNAGMLLKNFDYSKVTDAQTLAALLTDKETQENHWLGATKGGITVNEGRSYWKPTFDGKRKPFVGELQFDTADPVVSGTLVEYTPENVKAVSAAADIAEAEGNPIVTVQPRASIKKGDYLTNLVWVTNHGMDGLYLVDLKNALCTTGLSGQSTDKDIGTLAFEFHGHDDSVEASDDLPIKYLFFGASSEAEASSTEETTEPAE